MKQYVIFFDRISRVRKSDLTYNYKEWHNTAVVIAKNATEAKNRFRTWAQHLSYHPFHVVVTVDGSENYKKHHDIMWEDANHIDNEKPYIIMREN